MVATTIVAGMLALLQAGGVSMNGRIMDGEILDNRVTACGVHVEEGPIARIRPFIEASADLAGTFSLGLSKRSASGTSVTRQSRAFEAGTLDGVAVAIDAPSSVAIELDVRAADGTALCRLSRKLEIGEGTIDL